MSEHGSSHYSATEAETRKYQYRLAITRAYEALQEAERLQPHLDGEISDHELGCVSRARGALGEIVIAQ